MEYSISSALWTTFFGLFTYWIYRKLRQPYDTLRRWGCARIPCWPLIGNFQLDTAPWDRHIIQHYKHNKVLGIIALRSTSLIVFDHELLKNILVKDAAIFADRTLMAINPKPLNRSLFSLSSEHWKHVRGLVSPTFTSGKLKAMQTLLDRAAQNALDYLHSRADPLQPIEIRDFFTRYTMDAVASTLFGLDVDSHKDPDHPFVKHALKSFDLTLFNPAFFLAFLCPELRWLVARFGSFMMNLGAVDFFRKIVENALDERRQNPDTRRHDFLQIIADNEIPESECDRVSVHYELKHECNWSDQGLTRDEIFGQAVTFMAAGFETTATTLQMLAYNLTVHPEIQEKVVNEIQQVLGEEIVQYDDLAKFPYLDMCIQETLRLYPPVSRTERLCTQTVQYGNITIHEGTAVTLPIYALHMDSDVYENPLKFHPERFTPEAKVKRSQMSFLPFGLGPRSCIGMRLALQEVKLMIIRLLQEFRLEPCDETQSPDELDFGYKGLLVLFTPIKIKIVPIDTN